MLRPAWAFLKAVQKVAGFPTQQILYPFCVLMLFRVSSIGRVANGVLTPPQKYPTFTLKRGLVAFGGCGTLKFYGVFIVI
jgi:hypothetical protein